MLEPHIRTQSNGRGGRRAALAAALLAAAACLFAGPFPASAETPRERKETEAPGTSFRPALQPRTPVTSQQQERQDRARPAPVRQRTKAGESQQDARKRRNKDRALKQ